jgi:hypothetical protein
MKRRYLLSVYLSILGTLSGCNAQDSDTHTTTTTDLQPGNEGSNTVTTSTKYTESTVPGSPERITPSMAFKEDISIIADGQEQHNVTVEILTNKTNDSIYSEEFIVGGDSSGLDEINRNVEFPQTGRYDFLIEVQGEKRKFTYDIDKKNPGPRYSVYIYEDGSWEFMPVVK